MNLYMMRIAASDPNLFEHLLARAGMRVVRRDTDPLRTTVQNESVFAVASAMCEDINDRVRISPQQKALKEMAERAGYIVMLEFSPEEFEQEAPEDTSLSPATDSEPMMDAPVAGDEGLEPEIGPEPEMGPEPPMDGASSVDDLADCPPGECGDTTERIADLARDIINIVSGPNDGNVEPEIGPEIGPADDLDPEMGPDMGPEMNQTDPEDEFMTDIGRPGEI